MLSPIVTDLRGGKEEEIPSQKLFPGGEDQRKARGDGGKLCAAPGAGEGNESDNVKGNFPG